jgi:hypothetical protein
VDWGIISTRKALTMKHMERRINRRLGLDIFSTQKAFTMKHMKMMKGNPYPKDA